MLNFYAFVLRDRIIDDRMNRIPSNIIASLLSFAQRELVLLIFLLLLLIMFPFCSCNIWQLVSFVDKKTVVSLAGLLVVATALKESGYFSYLASKMLSYIKTERVLAIFFVCISAVLATFLTNDIALFIVVPLTLAFEKFVNMDVIKLVIFEAIAVNVGSALTPIGNPQNLYLWHRWGISFLSFVREMFPVVLLLWIVLLLFVWLAFPNQQIKKKQSITMFSYQENSLFFLSSISLLVFIICLEFGYVYAPFVLICTIYGIFYREIFVRTDWLLILIFILIFIDFHILSTLSIIKNFVHSAIVSPSMAFSNVKIFLSSVITSQVISNVPASIFLSEFSTDWKAICYGVNVGGNGLLWSSLANIIALRLLRKRTKESKIWLEFHLFSLPYFFLTTIIICWFLR